MVVLVEVQLMFLHRGLEIPEVQVLGRARHY
jgi:hypothetical protein